MTAALRALELGKRIVVAGGGIMGASITWHLARRGADVTLVEKQKPGAGATGDSFAWINATFSKQPQHYYDLNLMGVSSWRRLQQAMKKPPEVQWGGSVEWYGNGSQADELKARVERHQEWGYSSRFIDESEMMQLLPGLKPGPIQVAAFSDQEGTVDPSDATNALIAEAKQFGALVQYPCELTSIQMEGARVHSLLTTSGTLKADVFVVACGIGTPKIAAMAGIKVPLKDSPGILAHTLPQPRLLHRLALGPGSHIKQGPGGRFVVGDNFSGGEGSDASPVRGELLLKNAARYLPKLQTKLDRISQGWRVMPIDEYPIIGFTDQCPNLYVVATHSGITLAPLFGQFAAAEILDGARVDLLEPYRLARFRHD